MSTAGQHLSGPERSPQRRRRHILLAAAFFFSAALAGGGWYLWDQARVPEPFTVEWAGVDPEVARAVEAARHAVCQTPRSAPAWGRLGMVLVAHDFRAEANPCFAQAERLDPRDPLWPYLQGVTLQQGDPEAAIPKLQRAVDLSGAALVPRFRLAEALLEQGRFDDAEGHFRQVLRLEPDHPRAHLGLGRLAFRRDDLRGSVDHLQRSALSPFIPKGSRLLLAEVNQRLGNQPAADEQLQQAARLSDDPPWPDPWVEEVEALRVGVQARIARADQLRRQGRPEEALALLEETVRNYPASDRAWLALGKTLVHLGDNRAAERALHEAIRLAPATVEAQFYLGVALYRQRAGRAEALAAAVECFRRAAKLKPADAAAHYSLGLCLQEQGDGGGAVSAFQRALRCQPNYPDAHRNLGELLARQGQKEAALVHVQHALRLAPADSEAQKLLEHLRRETNPPRN